MTRRVLSDEELEQRRAAGRKSAERRRQNASQRLETHRDRQDTDPYYRAVTTDTIVNQKLPLQIGTLGGLAGAGAGFGLGYAISPPSGKFFPMQAKDNKNLVTRTMFGMMEGGGRAAGWTAGNLANEGLGALSSGNRRWRELRGKGPGGFDWDPTARRTTMSGQGGRIGASIGRGLYNVYGSLKGMGTNVLHAATGRRRGVTAAIMGLPAAIGLGSTGYGLGHWAGTSFAPYFPQEVRKVNVNRLRKSLDFAVSVRKEMELSARGPGRPRGRALSAEEIEQRREAGRASAARRRAAAAAAAGVDENSLTSRGLPRIRAYTPRVREDGGTFRSYSGDETETLTRGRLADRLAANDYAERTAYQDSDGKIRRGDGQFRASRRSREERTFDRFLGESIMPGYGRHAAKVIGSVKEASDVSDPAAKYGVIGGGLGLAAGGLIGSTKGQKIIGNAVWRGYGRVVPKIIGGFTRGARMLGLSSPGKGTRAIRESASGMLSATRSSRYALSYPGTGLMRSFGSSMFLAPAVGAAGFALGRAFGTSLRDRDYSADRVDTRQRDIERRLAVGGR